MNKSLDKLMSDYIDLLNKFGETSEEVKSFLDTHKDKEVIQQLAEAAMKLKENFNNVAIPINIPDSKQD